MERERGEGRGRGEGESEGEGPMLLLGWLGEDWRCVRICMRYMHEVYAWRIWMAYMHEVYEWRACMRYMHEGLEVRVRASIRAGASTFFACTDLSTSSFDVATSWHRYTWLRVKSEA